MDAGGCNQEKRLATLILNPIAEPPSPPWLAVSFRSDLPSPWGRAVTFSDVDFPSVLGTGRYIGGSVLYVLTNGYVG